MSDLFVFAAGSAAGIFLGGIVWIVILARRWSKALEAPRCRR